MTTAAAPGRRMTCGFGLVIAATAVGAWTPPCTAQNDWQFPDPYFGILEIEKSRPPALDRRPPPAEVVPAPRAATPRARLLRSKRRHVSQPPRR